jgi:hypothetical protein
MMRKHRELESLSGVITSRLPQIDGVTWKCDIARGPVFHNYRVYVTASFEVEQLETNSNIEEVCKKIHQITCGGQIKLELER